MTRCQIVTTLSAALGLLAFVAPRAVAEEYPRIHIALFELREARTELKEAKHDFGGHRVKALEAVDAAIKQLDAAMKAVDENIKGTKPEKEVYKDYPNHPHIRHALTVCREARTDLKEAAHDFKGHRVQAIEALDTAIAQLKKALEFAK